MGATTTRPNSGLGGGEMICEVCIHPTRMHRAIKGQVNVHLCGVCQNKCELPDRSYDGGAVEPR